MKDRTASDELWSRYMESRKATEDHLEELRETINEFGETVQEVLTEKKTKPSVIPELASTPK